jgi:hypothetical protein
MQALFFINRGIGSNHMQCSLAKSHSNRRYASVQTLIKFLGIMLKG